jgi:hypothetical protein
MNKRITLAASLGVLAMLAAGCGDDASNAEDSRASDSTSGDTGTSAVKVAFVTKFPVSFFTAMSDAA